MDERQECCHKTKERSEKEYKDLLNRLSRIEGQVRGLKRMVENEAYCPDILIQVSAVNAALNSFNRVLLANHIRTFCLVWYFKICIGMIGGMIYGTIYGNGYELCGVQRPRGKGCL